jgi:VanZ family protein
VKKSHWILIAYALFLLTLSSIPGDAFPEFPDQIGLDKLVHFALYYGLAALAINAFEVRDRRRWLVLAGVIAFGILDEIHQAWIPGRIPSHLDAIADILGAAAAVLVSLRGGLKKKALEIRS